jgi:thymidylate synthase (FAD)
VKNSVKLVSQSVPQIEGCTTLKDLVAYCARVSNPGNQLNHETAAKLFVYLMKHKHWSPFEMVSITMEIETTRDIARQILRHRSFSFQEFSQRYAEVKAIEPVIREARLQDTKNRQNSIKSDDPNLQRDWEAAQREVWELAHTRYQQLLARGVAKEQARALLPEGLTPSTLYMAGTLRSWIHYIELRTGAETQAEHREIAEGCKRVIIRLIGDFGDA